MVICRTLLGERQGCILVFASKEEFNKDKTFSICFNWAMKSSLVFENNIYTKTIYIIRKMQIAVLLFAFGGFVLAVLSDRLSGSEFSLIVPRLFLWSALAYIAHSYVLFPGRSVFVNFKKQYFVFFKRFLGLSLLILIPIAVTAFLIAFNFNGEGSDSEQQLIGIVILVVLPLAGVISGLIFSLLGTWLPAAVIDDNTGLKKALNRGHKTFFGHWFG